MKKIRQLAYFLGLMATGHRNIYNYMNEIEQNNKLSKSQIKKYQLKKINEILQYAYDNTEYYRKLLDDNKINPRIRKFSDLKKIPVLTKQSVNKNKESLISKKYQKKDLIRNTTGGSTGIPMVFYQDKKYFEFGVAYQNYLWKTMGCEIGDKIAYLWGSDKDFSARKIRDKINELIIRRKYLNTFRCTEKEIIRYAVKLRKYKPNLVVAYASSLYLFAKVADKNKLDVSIKTCQSSAETLTDDYRKYIEKILKTEIYNSYGSREVGTIGHECNQHNGLHESFQNNYIEIEDGRIIITNLNNYACPFIRYEIGDLGDKIIDEKCACGLNSRRIGKVTGRVSDNILTPENKYVHGEYFTHLFYNIKGIEKFQVIQEKKNAININVVATLSSADKAKFEKFVRKKVKEEVSAQIKVKVFYVKEIDTEQSGKFRFTISKVTQDEKRKL